MILFSLLYGMSALFAPWWYTVAVGMILLVRYQAWFVVLMVAIALDLVYGAPVQSLWGFSYVYTVYAAMLTLASLYLRDTILE